MEVLFMCFVDAAYIWLDYWRILANVGIFSIALILIYVFLYFSAFFGYKLYKSLTDRDRKREEKRLAKQSKKKK